MSKQAAPETEYQFRIERHYSRYVFGAGSPSQPTAHEEFLFLEFVASCVTPAAHAGERTEFLLIADRARETEMRERKPVGEKVKGVGRLKMRGQASNYSGLLPFDGVFPLISMVDAGVLRFVRLIGPALYKGETIVTSFELCRELDRAT
ncbi:hypothetical protein GGC65_001299 [Sphingopyxis sp. OAS728]|uniref:hypothetical protein n=1 Tax=Sphingopyxis sp. OAS728 TaxID=2663823 RepID=UPI0017899185|nr:hypothetical protein [Sphingopyxis sp. OAS728]MBE1526843.1 hypothetical protein [Sphingopyxis sp. OAS728]